MICKICKTMIIVPLNADMPAVFAAFDEHLRRYHPDQVREMLHQAASIMRWLTGRIFTLEGGAQDAHEDMTGRMVKLSASIKEEIEQAKRDKAAAIIAAQYDDPHPAPGPPKPRGR